MHPDPEDKRLIVAPNWRETFGIYDMATLQKTKTVHGHTKTPRFACWVDNARRAITSDGKAETFLWDAENWTRLRNIYQPSMVIFMPHRMFAGLIVNGELRLCTDNTLSVFPEAEVEKGEKPCKRLRK